MDGGRVVAIILLILLMSETGVQLFSHFTGWDLLTPTPTPSQPAEPRPSNSEDVSSDHSDHRGSGGDRKQVLVAITAHCLPKLVCQLHSLPSTETLTDSERNLINMIGSASIGVPSKYSFAAHMGQLMKGWEGQGCHNFYPECPFSNQDVLQIAKRINFK